MPDSGTWQEGGITVSYATGRDIKLRHTAEATVTHGGSAVTASVARSAAGDLKVIDVYCAGYPFGLGFGTLAFNTVLQVLKRRYPPETRVTGGVVPLGSETTSPDKLREGRARRVRYWQNFGFQVIVDEHGYGQISAPLGELQVYDPERDARGVLPRAVPIDTFNPAPPR